MIVRETYHSRELRTDDDRSAEALAFLNAVDAVCREHGFVIEHQDREGAFEIIRRDTPRADPDWLRDAHEIVHLDTA